MRFIASSMPQLPPRAAIRTPLTRIVRCGSGSVSATGVTAAERSPAAVSDSAQPVGVCLIAAWRTSISGVPARPPSVVCTFTRRSAPAASNSDRS